MRGIPATRRQNWIIARRDVMMPGVWRDTLGTSAMIFGGQQAYAWLVRDLPEIQVERLQRLVSVSPELRQRLELATDEADPLIQAVRQWVSSRPDASDEELLDGVLALTLPQASSSWKPPDSEATLVQKQPGTLSPEESASSAHRKAPETIRDYRLLEVIGEGGMGTVYRAMHMRLKKIVAIKVLLKDATPDRRRIARFEREMEAIGRLQHPHIVAALDAGETDGAPYLVMEYVEGLDAGQLVALSGRLTVPDACEVARQAALGLQHIHIHGLVHRDIKPSNLILTRPMAGADCQIKLLDLGLALLTAEGASTLTQTDRFMGTLSYMAPEQADRPHDVDIRADLYSLGCTLYFLISGEPPFPTRRYPTVASQIRAQAQDPPVPLRLAMPALPPALDALILRLLAKAPADRFDTPADVATALNPFCAGSNLAKLFEGSAPPRAPLGDQTTAAGTSAVEDPAGTPSAQPTTVGPFPSPSRLQRLAVFGVAAVALLVVVLVSQRPWGRGSRPSTADPSSPAGDPPLQTDGPRPPAGGFPRITTPAGLDLIEVPAGTFVMGSKAGDEAPQRRITITAPLFIAATEIPRGMFAEFVSATRLVPDSAKGGHGLNPETGVLEGPDPRYTWESPGWEPYGDDHPVVNVSWNDAVAFCNWLSETEGRTRCYDLSNGKTVLVEGTGYRLPTEAEWEYVCRLSTRTLDGRDEPGLPSGGAVARFKYTAPVRDLAESPLGVKGMLGSVWEWCEDWYDADVSSAAGPRNDPHGPVTGTHRVHRGGSWDSRAEVCRASTRGWAPAEACEAHLGFRVIRSAVRPLPREPRSPVRLRARPASPHSAWDDLNVSQIPEADRPPDAPPELVALLRESAEGSARFVQAFAVEGTVLTGDETGQIKQWRPTRPGLIPKYIPGKDRTLVILACDRRRSQLVTREKFGPTIQVWKRVADAILDVMTIDTGPVSSAAFAQDGMRVALGLEGQVELWDIRDMRPQRLLSLPYSEAQSAEALAFAAGDDVLLASVGMTLYHWNLHETAPLARADRGSRTLGIDVSRPGRLFAIYGEGWAGIETVAPSGLRELGRYSVDPGAVPALSPEGHHLAVSVTKRLRPGTIQVRDTLTGGTRHEIELPSAITAIDWTQDSRHLVTLNADGSVFVFRLAAPAP